MTIYFTSDTHFGHKNIIKYSNRPFTDVAEMNDRLIYNWNMTIQPDDQIYHLGDVAFCSGEETNKILAQLNGRKFLVKGNHDRETAKHCAKHFEWIRDYYELTVQDKEHPHGKQMIVLLHYAMKVWNKSHHGSWQLYGHSHGSLPDDPNSLSIDVGVDANNYTPLSYTQIKEIMSHKTYKPLDHHRSKYE